MASETPDGTSADIDDLLPRSLREMIEERWWRPVEAGATIEALRTDPDFLAEPGEHPALFADHGVVHVRDIATGVVKLAEIANGLLLPRRPAERQHFLVAAAVLITYLHDVGMADPTRVGRRVHAVWGAQVPFTADADDIIDLLIADRGAVVRRLESIDREDPFDCPLPVVLRELWSLNMAHSKSTVPSALLSDPSGLRRLMQHSVFTSLDEHRRRERTPIADSPHPPTFEVHVERYEDPHASYGWLTSSAKSHQALTHDVIDGLRVLRSADALRQRGTTLRTAAGYEVFIDVQTGAAVFALREANNRALHLLRVERRYPAGEANLRVATVTPHGDLRVAVNRGAFDTEVARDRAVKATAEVVVDIALDVLPSFDRVSPSELPPPIVAEGSMHVLIERPSDRGRFADEVVTRVQELCPALRDRVRAVAAVEDAEPVERERYLCAVPVGPDGDQAARILAGVAACGLNVDAIDPATAFADVRLARVHAGEELVAAGSSPMFVYLPSGAGLEVIPGGGYVAEDVPAWLPVGVTGAVRRAERNASIVARAELDVVIIPADVFVHEWFRPHAPDELAAALLGIGGS